MAKTMFLSFEQPIAELNAKIEELRLVQGDSSVDISEEISQLEEKHRQLIEEIYSGLTPWQVSQIARHPNRPYTLDYIQEIFTDFRELHGDRAFADDPAIVGGLARLDGIPCMVIGHQKGRDIKERSFRNFGMPRPEGYRKALRLMKQAEKFHRPVVCFVDTSGAYCGIGAEERGQGQAIAENLMEMMTLDTPVLSVLVGEGGSGGALALAVADQVWMLENSVYSVISPEGCASILWKDASLAEQAAQQLKLTAQDVLENGMIERILSEQELGKPEFYDALAADLRSQLEQLAAMPAGERLEARYQRFRRIGRSEG